ncbi:hypothetical protein [Actinoplanes awajinensis]|nr:hypothetical protein [Actinoplanes awajinensis]
MEEPDRPSKARSMVGLGVAFALLLVPAGGVALFALVVSAFEVGSRVLALLAALVAGAGVVCGVLALAAGSSGKAERARQLMTADFLITLGAVVGAMLIPTHGE